MNKFGSYHLNILAGLWDKADIRLKEIVELEFKDKKIHLMFVKTFSDVLAGDPLIMKDDYGRIELAINQGSFSTKYHLEIGDKIIVRRIENRK